MGSANQGTQRIGWKYSTPLQADYLNTFIAGFSTEGLITRPAIDIGRTSSGADITIHPFSLLICPEDTISTLVKDEDGNYLKQKMVKITTTNDVKISITEYTMAVGFEYTFKEPAGTMQSQWYGEIVPLTPNKLAEFNGIIIATCQVYKTPDEVKHYSVTTSGADISDFLLINEGWNPQKWFSLIHPKRALASGIYYNKLEVRTHNDSYKGYINGNSGLTLQTNLTYTLNTDVHPINNPDGIRGFMPKNYNAFKLQSDGFNIAECSDTLPIEKTSGGIFAIVDATSVNNRTPDGAFTNKLKIKPVHQEDINIYYDQNTLFIR